MSKDSPLAQYNLYTRIPSHRLYEIVPTVIELSGIRDKKKSRSKR